ncbi:hypothetical protein BZG36_04109 [Bifiguratus adelaidae]|uniref:Micro-fibrillar-associated protein 1 C-terminal domain-containing protein n=1 Tax=Bifiguratus adelaidae TaxID=1938954 RepID=A0A261XVT2_9FUNG|nr:hypothetical protein BZG36_04109 [Bifiguratus adelaidae]
MLVAKRWLSQEPSDDDEEEEEQEIRKQQALGQTKRSSIAFNNASKEVVTGIQRVEITEADAQGDRRLRRLQESRGSRQEKARQHDDTSTAIQEEQEEEEEEDEAALARKRALLKERARQRLAEEQRVEGAEEESEEEESSEYETDSEEEEQEIKLVKPVFISKSQRDTVKTREKLEAEEAAKEEARKKQLEERRLQSHNMVAEQIKRELEAPTRDADGSGPPEVDDTDDVDPAQEYEEWKIRELMRIKRDKEEKAERERELEELERYRALPEHIRLKEDLKRAEESRKKEKGQQAFMQRYYHKGAFYLDKDDEIFKRDYTAATPDEIRNRELLPKVMQVKNFGKHGQTKYTHLVDQDTSQFDAGWAQKTDINKRVLSRMGGIKDDFGRSSKRSRY